MSQPGPEPAPDPALPAARPIGLFRFALEGRRAPAIFVAGWLATLVGGGSTLVGLMAGGGAGVGLIVLGLAVLTAGLVLLGGAQALERAAVGLAYAGPSPILVFAAAIAASLLAFLAVGVPLGLFDARLDRPLGDLITGALQALVWIAIVRIMVIGSGALTWRSMGFRSDGRLLAVVTGVLWAFPVVAATALLATVLVALLGATPPSPLPPTGTASGTILHLLAGAVVAPISEEIVFRGVAATAWARMAGPTAAIVRSSLLFAFAHVLLLGGNDFGQAAALVLVAALGRLPVAVALAWTYLRSGSIWTPIALHATFNAILILVAEFATAAGS